MTDIFELRAIENRLGPIAEDAKYAAHSSEFGGKVLSAPDPKQIRAEQGYTEPGYKPFSKGAR